MIIVITAIIAVFIGIIIGIIIGLLLRDAARADLQNQNTILREQYDYLKKWFDKNL